MATEFHHCRTWQDLNHLALVEDSPTLDIIRVHPFLILVRQVHRAVKLLGPLEMSRIEVGMRNGNSFQTATLVDEVNGRLVEQADAVPEDVSMLGLDKDGALADGELGTGEDGMNAGVFFVLLDLVVVGGFHESEGGEGVAGRGDELTGFLFCKWLKFCSRN